MSFYVIIAVALLVIGSTNLYLARRIWGFLTHFIPKLPFWPLVALFAALVLVLVLGFSRSMLPLPTAVKQALGVANACWMGVFVYLLLFFLLADVAYLVVRLIRPVERVFFLAGALVLTVAVCGYGFFHATELKQKDYDITIPGAKEITVVLISDVHLGAVGSEKRLPVIVEKINSLNPDLICIAGDFFDSDFTAIRNPETAAATLKTLSAPYGVWAVLGNHDAGSTAAQMQEYLTQCGIRLLNDQYAVVGEKLVLGGKMDRSPIGGFGNLTGSDLVLTDINDLPVIVMDHNPAHIHQYGPEVDLILSGHTHKGQIFPGSLITNGLYTVDYGYYRKNEESPQVIVSSGVGTWGMPMRVGSDCEIVKIEIHS